MMGDPKTILRKQNGKSGVKLKDSEYSVGSQNKRAPTRVYKFRVDMWCEGCALDVKQALELAKSGNVISDYSIDYRTKKVTITTNAKLEEVSSVLGKAGKSFSMEESKIMEVVRTRK